MRPRTCKTCSCVFTGGPRAWYCPNCRAERQKMAGKQYKERARAGKTRPNGSIDLCENCGKKYIVKGGLQKYCEKCAPEMIKELDRIQGIKWYEKNKDKINPVRNEKRQKKERKCVICGKTFEGDGTCRNTCSETCRKIQIQRWQRKADDKRRRKKDL